MTILGKINSPSAKALAERLVDSPIQVRWGGARSVGAVQGSSALLNAVQQLEALKAAGIPCPEYTTSYATALEWLEADVKVLGRNLCHSQGFDIIPHWKDKIWPAAKRRISRATGKPGPRMNRDTGVATRFAGKDFWVKAVPNITNEWRVHVMRSPRSDKYYSIAMGLKSKVTEVRASAAQAGFEIRSRRLGWHLRHDVDLPKAIREAAKAACAAVKYDFGAVDILDTTAGPVVLEVNSAPALRDDYTLTRYANALIKYYGPKAKD